MVAPHMMKASKPNHQPRAQRATLAGGLKKDYKENNPRPVGTQPLIASLTIRCKQDSLVGNTSRLFQSIDHHQVADNDRPRLPFQLKKALPRVGLRFPDDKNHKETILGRVQRDAQVAWALCADMEERSSDVVQNLVSPVFHKAAMMIEEGALLALVARHEDIEEADGNMIWARFLAKLQAESPKKWPRKLSVVRFFQFISALAEARWWEIQLPKNDGRSHSLLVQHISLFLAAAENACFPWANGGDVFCHDDDEDDDMDDDE